MNLKVIAGKEIIKMWFDGWVAHFLIFIQIKVCTVFLLYNLDLIITESTTNY